MNVRRLSIIVFTIVLIVAVSAGVVNALNANPKPVSRLSLDNVRDYAAAPVANGRNYAVDGGVLFGGQPSNWVQVITPNDVIVSAVAVDRKHPETLYIGAANEMAIYRSEDGGQTWLRVQLTDKTIGGVTDIAVDSAQRLVYVGTDNAGLFRLRDVGSSMILGGQLVLDEPVVQVAADGTGAGMAFARTQWHLYRAENFGLSWVTVDNLKSAPTAVAIADTQPATVFVGTVDRGLLESHDGLTWQPVNSGLGVLPGSRLQVDALAVDPAQPSVVYVATSYLYGTAQIHEAPAGIAVSTDGAQVWKPVSGDQIAKENSVAELLPITGQTGAVYALTTESRTPQPVGNVRVAASVPVAQAAQSDNQNRTWPATLAWVVAALATMALVFAVATDLRGQEPDTRETLAPRTIRRNG